MKSKIHEYQNTSKKSRSKNFTIYLALILCLFASKMIAQETFEARAKAIALKIEKIAKEEKETLKISKYDLLALERNFGIYVCTDLGT